MNNYITYCSFTNVHMVGFNCISNWIGWRAVGGYHRNITSYLHWHE